MERQLTVVEESKPQLVKLTDVAIETIAHNIRQSERLVFSVLEKDIDYGRIPGTPQDGLWDPGASKIINAFNAYPDYRVLHHVEEDSLISYTIQSMLTSRESQMVVGSGIGAASTKETKYKYRWVPDPKNYGYSEEEIKALKFKDGKYRITNPEYGELVNTMAKMACKRADVDAAQSLPGVGSALRKLFTGKASRLSNENMQPPNWNSFWNQVSALGLSEDDVHQMLEVKSIKDWLASGKTLNQAVETLSQKLTNRRSPAPQQKQRDSQTIKTFGDLYTACREDKNLQNRQAVWAELGVNSQEEITETPAECYRKIAAVR
jgi:hypothetical protein